MKKLLNKKTRYPASCIRSTQALVSPRCDHQLIFNSFLRDLSCRMPSVCGTTLTLTSSPLYPTNRLQQATHANYSNLTRTEPAQMNHCRPFTIQEQRTQDFARQANASAAESFISSQPASSQIEFQTGSDKTINQLKRTPLVSQVATTPSTNQSRTTPSYTPISSCLSSETRFVPCFTSNRVVKTVNSVAERSVSCNQNWSTSATRLIPTFSKKRVQPGGHKPTLTATVSQARVGNSLQTQNSTLLASLQPSSRIARRMENTSQGHALSQHRVHRGSPDYVTNGEGINGTMEYGVGDHPSPTAVQRNAIVKAQSADSSTQVMKRLPQSRPGLVITQAVPTSGQRQREKNATPQEFEGIWDINSLLERDSSDTPTSTLSVSVCGPGEHTAPLHPLQLHESFPAQFYSNVDRTRKRQVPF